MNDADLQSQFLDRARTRLRDLHRPTTGEPLAQAIAKERSKWIDDELGEMGMKRAKHWGWPNTYTYTKSIGEQMTADWVKLAGADGKAVIDAFNKK